MKGSKLIMKIRRNHKYQLSIRKTLLLMYIMKRVYTWYGRRASNNKRLAEARRCRNASDSKT